MSKLSQTQRNFIISKVEDIARRKLAALKGKDDLSSTTFGALIKKKAVKYPTYEEFKKFFDKINVTTGTTRAGEGYLYVSGECFRPADHAPEVYKTALAHFLTDKGGYEVKRKAVEEELDRIKTEVMLGKDGEEFIKLLKEFEERKF